MLRKCSMVRSSLGQDAHAAIAGGGGTAQELKVTTRVGNERRVLWLAPDPWSACSRYAGLSRTRLTIIDLRKRVVDKVIPRRMVMDVIGAGSGEQSWLDFVEARPFENDLFVTLQGRKLTSFLVVAVGTPTAHGV